MIPLVVPGTGKEPQGLAGTSEGKRPGLMAEPLPLAEFNANKQELHLKLLWVSEFHHSSCMELTNNQTYCIYVCVCVCARNRTVKMPHYVKNNKKIKVYQPFLK